MELSENEVVALNFANKLARISSERHFAKLRDSTPLGGCLFHYTSVSGLHGIVADNCLHASAAYFLNDSSELEYGRRILDKVLDEWEVDNPEARDNVTAELVRDLRSKINHEDGHEALVQSVHLACFCQRDNVLSQWRAYGQAGGYSMGFPVEHGSIRNLTPEAPSYTALLTRVEYEEEAQIRKCKEILELVLPIVDDPTLKRILRTTNAFTYHGPMSTYEFILKAMQEMLLDEILAFKDKAFKEEDEWRLIVRPRLFLLQGTDDRGKTPTKIYFRPSRGLLVPYLKLVAPKGKLPFVSIRSGPSVDRARAEASVRLLLREYGFKDVAFSGSEIPVLM